jgi:hypothetical protein
MNVLLLTPDAVGSTLLQRLITIYMQFHTFDQPVINLHELTNGLEKFYSPDFNREILGKPNRVNKSWGYYQSLNEVIDLLASVDHYKTARLAEYHVNQRQDSISSQVPFYQYLNDNFFIIACRRRNLFEHALSWGLNKITKKLNVYTANEKINTFYDIYKNQVELDLLSFKQSLDRYRSYLTWSDNNFTAGSYFYYEDHIDNPEKYILGALSSNFGSLRHRYHKQVTEQTDNFKKIILGMEIPESTYRETAADEIKFLSKTYHN